MSGIRLSKKGFLTVLAFLIVVFLQLSSLPDNSQIQGVQTTKEIAHVLRVIDGDTFDVLLNNKKQKIRVIGINTPETVDPRRPVECFGKEAANAAKAFLRDKDVALESDPNQQNQDKYGRLLRYVFIDNIDFGKKLITEGYAYEYTYEVPYKYQKAYRQAQQTAQEMKKGLWADTACPKNSSE